MNEVYSQGKHQLLRAAPLRWLRFRLYDVVWRLRKSWMVWAGLAAGAVFFGIMGLIVWRVTAHKDPSTALKTLAAIATPLAAILGVGTTLWGITRGLQNWLLVHSAEGARSGLTKACDPLALVRDRFEGLVRNLALPVAVIIDDLDRCQPTYVVELLEGIQTLFAGAPVAYIVAADGRWLRDSFEEVYKTFLDMPSELGRPLGYQFTEKTFQLSTKVPRMGTDSRRLYLGGLLGGEETQSDQPITPVTVQAAQARTFDDASAAVAAARTPEEEAAAIEQALVRTQSASIQKQTEHFLLGFDSLIESNPRTMKRLVNAYGMARDLELVEAGSAVSRGPRAAGELALWTILGLRWPLLAEHLEGSPGDVALIGADPVSTSVPVELQQLFADQDVVDVVRGVGVSAQLDEGAVRRLVRRPLAATPPPPPP
jgi:hypothetical protein